MKQTKYLFVAAAMFTIVFAGIILPTPAQAQTFPSKRFTIIVSSSAGGSFDTMGRLLADHLRRKSDQPVIVDNRPGANDVAAIMALIAAPADGHTIAIAGNQIAGLFMKDVPFDLAAVTPVTIFAQSPYAIVASKASNLRNFKEFLAYAKANPGKLNIGAATSSHSLNMYAIQDVLGFEGKVILYKGFAPLETAVLSGEVELSVFGNLGKVKTGQITALVTAGDVRNPDIPDVPTFKELGIKYEPRANYSAWMRIGVPADVMDRLVKECQEAVRSPEWTARVTNGLGIKPVGATREFATKYLAEELQGMKATANRAGIKPQ